CCYHGWVYDVDGRCLATPGEPHGSRLRERVRQGAYPTHEFAGLVFAYLGPPDGRPAFPRYDSYELPGYQLKPAAQFVLPCNWLQVKDNSMDPVHTAFLHALSSGYQFTEAFGVVHELEHLASADRGVITLRRTVRDGIHAVARGGDPHGTRWPAGKIIRTFAQDLVLRVPPAASPEADRRLLRATGRSVITNGRD